MKILDNNLLYIHWHNLIMKYMKVHKKIIKVLIIIYQQTVDKEFYQHKYQIKRIKKVRNKNANYKIS